MNSLNYNSFRDEISHNPLLTREQEVDLSRRAKKGDRQARQKLIASNYRLAISIASKYSKRGVNFDDLLQESSIGLIKAIDRFNPELGNKLSTYACWWIKQACMQFINENISTVKVPTHSRLLNSKIKKTVTDIQRRFGYTPTTSELSEILSVTEDAIEHSNQANSRYLSINGSSNGDDDNSYSLENKIDSLELTPQEVFENKELVGIIKKNLNLLSPREEKVIRLRFGIEESFFDNENFPGVQ